MRPTGKVEPGIWVWVMRVIGPIVDAAVGRVHVATPVLWFTYRLTGGQPVIVKTVI